MNQTKATLVKVSGIFAMIDAIGSIFAGLFLATSMGYFGETLTGYGMVIPNVNISREAYIAIGIVLIILGIFSIIGGSLLINVTNSNKVFQTSTKYKTGCAFTIIGGGFMSIACILLYISFFYKNQPSNELRSGEFNSKAIYYDYGDDKSEQVDDSIKNKVSLLRELKNKGEINDQEFRDMLMDLIKRKEEQD